MISRRILALALVAKAAPDGYTLLVTPQTSIAVAPALYGADTTGGRAEIARHTRILKETGIKAE